MRCQRFVLNCTHPMLALGPFRQALWAYLGASQMSASMLNNDLSHQKSFLGRFPKSSPLSLTSSFIYLSKSSQQMVFRFAHIDFASCRNMPEHLSQCRTPNLYNVGWACMCVCFQSTIPLPDVESVSHTLHLPSQRKKKKKISV